MKKIYRIFSIFAFSCSRKGDNNNNGMISEFDFDKTNEKVNPNNLNKVQINFCLGKNEDFEQKKGGRYYKNYGSETNL